MELLISVGKFGGYGEDANIYSSNCDLTKQNGTSRWSSIPPVNHGQDVMQCLPKWCFSFHVESPRHSVGSIRSILWKIQNMILCLLNAWWEQPPKWVPRKKQKRISSKSCLFLSLKFTKVGHFWDYFGIPELNPHGHMVQPFKHPATLQGHLQCFIHGWSRYLLLGDSELAYANTAGINEKKARKLGRIPLSTSIIFKNLVSSWVFGPVSPSLQIGERNRPAIVQ